MNKTSKILIVGGSGFVGRYLAAKLTNYQVTYLIRPSSKIEHLKGEKIIRGDITYLNSLLQASKNQDIIINLATPNTQRDEINEAVIVGGTRNLIAAARKNKIKKLVILSSVAGYRQTKDSYGQAKLQADKLLLQSGLDIIILKPTMIFGHGGYVFEKIKSALSIIPVVVFLLGDGRYKIQPIYVEDVVQSILHSLEKPMKGVEIFDLGGPYPIECRQFFQKILRVQGKKKLLIPIPLSLVKQLARFVNLLNKNAAFNSNTIKRMTEEVKLDIQKTQKELNLRLTDYDEAIRKLFS